MSEIPESKNHVSKMQAQSDNVSIILSLQFLAQWPIDKSIIELTAIIPLFQNHISFLWTNKCYEKLKKPLA